MDTTGGPRPDASGDLRRSMLAGARGILPLFVPAVPFGLVLGLAINESGIGAIIGWSSSVLIFGGAAQLVAVTLLGDGAPALSAIGAAMLVNLRHVMYSAALVPRFRGQPRWFRWAGPYVLIDQVFALVSVQPRRGDDWRGYYLGAGLTVWLGWQVAVAIGVVAGPYLPDIDLSFAVPAMFLGLLVPALTDRPRVVGAVCAAATTAALSGIPNRGGMLVGAVVGVACAVAVASLGTGTDEAAAEDEPVNGDHDGDAGAGGEAGA
ncbi:MAG: AzlC family ABC transporter permease [Actinomycetota bacterium]|nr:AzlC family ABC transporter permease [Actinomycetota bacterium]